MNGGDYYEFEAGHFAPKVHDEFSGGVYESEHTMVDDNAYRFETSELKLRNIVVLVSTQNALVGDSSSQRFPKSTGTELSLNSIDISKLYFKNAGAGLNTKINIIGTKI